MILFLAAGAQSLQKVSSCHSRLLEPSAISPSCENSGSHQQQILSNCIQISYFGDITPVFHIITHVERCIQLKKTKTMGFVNRALGLTPPVTLMITLYYLYKLCLMTFKVKKKLNSKLKLNFFSIKHWKPLDKLTKDFPFKKKFVGISVPV